MRVLESTFSNGDSVLGIHSGDLAKFRATADHQSSSAPKPPKNYESPTAIPRILEEESQANQSSLRADSGGEAIHNQKTQKMDSRNFTQAAQSLSTPQGKKAESVFSNQPQAAASLDSSKSPSDSKILDEKCGLQGKSQRSYLSGDLWDFSPLPHFSLKAESPQVDSRIFTQTTQPAHHDSKNCGVASGAFCGFWGRARLEVCGYPKIHKIAAMDTQS